MEDVSILVRNEENSGERFKAFDKIFGIVHLAEAWFLGQPSSTQ